MFSNRFFVFGKISSDGKIYSQDWSLTAEKIMILMTGVYMGHVVLVRYITSKIFGLFCFDIFIISRIVFWEFQVFSFKIYEHKHLSNVNEIFSTSSVCAWNVQCIFMFLLLLSLTAVHKFDMFCFSECHCALVEDLADILPFSAAAVIFRLF